MKSDIYLNIGSNSGDRNAFIARAVAALRSAFPEGTLTLSRPVASDPWGFESASEFLNIGVHIRLDVEEAWTAERLYTLLDTVQTAEKSISAQPHRNTDGSYRDREVDIDIIAVDKLVIDTPRLTLPHPKMELRPFVLIPMQELAPEWRHPSTGLNCSEMLQ